VFAADASASERWLRAVNPELARSMRAAYRMSRTHGQSNAHTASIATCIFVLVQSANRDRGSATCLPRRHAAGDLRLDMLFDVEAKFIVEFCIDLLGREE